MTSYQVYLHKVAAQRFWRILKTHSIGYLKLIWAGKGREYCELISINSNSAISQREAPNSAKSTWHIYYITTKIYNIYLYDFNYVNKFYSTLFRMQIINKTNYCLFNYINWAILLCGTPVLDACQEILITKGKFSLFILYWKWKSGETQALVVCIYSETETKEIIQIN